MSKVTLPPVFVVGQYARLVMDAKPRPCRIRRITRYGRYVVDCAGENVPYTVPATALEQLTETETEEIPCSM